ncbi:MAG: PBECR4 domain-containing protein [Clostridia bacterium]|nr:PBECR4 domain-containing protein [Clostridia bacterium]
MDKIQQCAQNFLHLVSTTKYVFHVAKRGVKVLTLDFDLKDFHHLVGLQYLDDINIPKNKKKTIDWILSEKHPITDAYLAGSEHYKGNIQWFFHVKIKCFGVFLTF